MRAIFSSASPARIRTTASSQNRHSNSASSALGSASTAAITSWEGPHRHAAVSARVGALRPAPQRIAPDHGDIAVRGDPVTSAQLGDEPDGVRRTRPFANGDQLVGPRIDLPATRVKGTERTPLLVGGNIKRMRTGPR